MTGKWGAGSGDAGSGAPCPNTWASLLLSTSKETWASLGPDEKHVSVFQALKKEILEKSVPQSRLQAFGFYKSHPVTWWLLNKEGTKGNSGDCLLVLGRGAALCSLCDGHSLILLRKKSLLKCPNPCWTMWSIQLVKCVEKLLLPFTQTENEPSSCCMEINQWTPELNIRLIWGTQSNSWQKDVGWSLWSELGN